MSRSLTEAQWNNYSKKADDRRQKQLQAAFEKGVQARKDGIPQHENPMISSGWRMAWAEGWVHQDEKEWKQQSMGFTDPTGVR